MMDGTDCEACPLRHAVACSEHAEEMVAKAMELAPWPSRRHATRGYAAACRAAARAFHAAAAAWERVIGGAHRAAQERRAAERWERL